MKIFIPSNIKEQLIAALKNAGNREIGGILMGKYIGFDEFNVEEITIEPKFGTFASFVRALPHALVSLNKFFKKTKYNYTHFNYMGEWHSHPSFIPTPSFKDISTMMDSINDKKVGANFLILIILKLSLLGSLEGSAMVFYPDLPFTSCDLIILDE